MLACGVYNIDSLADYEAYRARLAASEAGRENYLFAHKNRFIMGKDRTFLLLASGPHAPLKKLETS